MKTTARTVLAVIGGFLGGFVVYEMITRISLQLFESVPLALIGTLSMLLPIGGAVTALILVRRRRQSNN
jgi:uncharacterized protein (DUF983 family)